MKERYLGPMEMTEATTSGWLSKVQFKPSNFCPVALDDLPQWSPWPARLLGLEAWSTAPRTLEKIEQEYERDKYGRALDYVRQNARPTSLEQLRWHEVGRHPDDVVCVSLGDRLYSAKLAHALDLQGQLLAAAVAPYMDSAAALIELGCGYGYNLGRLAQQFPGKQFVGGDYSASAVELAAHLFHGQRNVRVQKFNFYDEKYELLEQLAGAGPVVVLTVFAIEQLKSSAAFVRLASACRYVTRVVHVEPVPPLAQAQGLLHLLRRKYTEMNDYCPDLLRLLLSRRDELRVEAETDVFGMNPLHPFSIVSWSPKA
jgi:SAM-dependent methyltransferase